MPEGFLWSMVSAGEGHASICSQVISNLIIENLKTMRQCLGQCLDSVTLLRDRRATLVAAASRGGEGAAGTQGQHCGFFA
jgi:hypothetical protein